MPLSDRQVYLKDFDSLVQRVHKDDYKFKRITEMTAVMKLEVSSTFYLHIRFTGNYDRGCGFTFNIHDDKREKIYTIDFRFNTKNRYRTLIQNYKFNSVWGKEAVSNLTDLARENDIYVSITDKYFEVTINNMEVTPKLGVLLERLHQYPKIQIIENGICIQFDVEKSFMRNGGRSIHNSIHFLWGTIPAMYFLIMDRPEGTAQEFILYKHEPVGRVSVQIYRTKPDEGVVRY